MNDKVKESTLGEYIITKGGQDYGIPNIFKKINKVIIKSNDCSYAFYDYTKLEYVDMSFADTSNVTNMGYMFNNCYGMLSLDLSSFDTSNVTDMGYMFDGSGKLETLDLSNFDTAKVKDMGYMFRYCYGMLSLDLSSFDTSSVTRMSYIFQSDSKLTSLTLSSKFFKSTTLTTYDFSGATAWTDPDSLATFVDALPQLTSTKTVKLSSNTKNALTDEQKTTIANKGWTIA